MCNATDEAERLQELIDTYRAALAQADAVIRAQRAVIDAATAPMPPATLQAVDLSRAGPVD